MADIRTFPLYFSESELEEIRVKAKKGNLSMKAYMHVAIREKNEKEEK